MLKDLVLRNRSYRRFHQDKPVAMETLRELADLARLAPAGANKQTLRYYLSNTKESNAKIFDTLAWAAYLKDWDGPEEGERPSGYIVMLKDSSVGSSPAQDEGFAAQNILLGAVELGMGGCFLANVKRQKLAAELKLDEKYELLSVIAIGYPKEEVVLEPMPESGDVRYWRDENGVHHVPKRALDDIIL